MGTLFTALPLDQEVASWLDDEGVSHPGPNPEARLPTPGELRSLLANLEGYEVRILEDISTSRWEAEIDAADSRGAWTRLIVRDFASPETPHDYYFAKGRPEAVLAVVSLVAGLLGPQVVFDDSSCFPCLVLPGDAQEKVLGRWNGAE